jgi:hypothetical protein
VIKDRQAWVKLKIGSNYDDSNKEKTTRINGLNSFNKTNLTFPCLKFIKNIWINKYLICGKQYRSSREL